MNLDHIRIFGPRENLVIGQDVHLGEETLINCNDTVTLGDHVMTGQRVMILAGGHDYTKINKERIASAPFRSVEVTICEGAWIGSGAIIVGPVRIGRHAVVCAGSVVVKDVPNRTMVGGNPAQFIKNII